MLVRYASGFIKSANRVKRTTLAPSSRESEESKLKDSCLLGIELLGDPPLVSESELGCKESVNEAACLRFMV